MIALTLIMLRIIRFFAKIILIAALLVGAWIAYEAITFPDIDHLRDHNPETTALMDQRADETRAK